jgi:hypothetical protein
MPQVPEYQTRGALTGCLHTREWHAGMRAKKRDMLS